MVWALTSYEPECTQFPNYYVISNVNSIWNVRYKITTLSLVLSYLWRTAYVFLHKSRVGIILDVMAVNVVLQMIESVISRTRLELQHTHLKYVDLKQPTNSSVSSAHVICKMHSSHRQAETDTQLLSQSTYCFNKTSLSLSLCLKTTVILHCKHAS